MINCAYRSYFDDANALGEEKGVGSLWRFEASNQVLNELEKIHFKMVRKISKGLPADTLKGSVSWNRPEDQFSLASSLLTPHPWLVKAKRCEVKEGVNYYLLPSMVK
jgi:hypothetical protein